MGIPHVTAIIQSTQEINQLLTWLMFSPILSMPDSSNYYLGSPRLNINMLVGGAECLDT